jgi:cardiolipin synthase
MNAPVIILTRKTVGGYLRLAISALFIAISLCAVSTAKGAAVSSMESEETAVVDNAETADSVPAVQHFLEERYGVDFSRNNRVVFFRNGQEKFDDMFRAVALAQRSIHMEYFNFRNDSISHELFSLLEKKAAEGVQVRILFDGFGNSSNDRPLRRSHLRTLRAAGVEIYPFDAIRFPYVNHVMHRDHRKIVVIDGMVAYTGGMNVADYYIKGKEDLGEWRDIHARVEGDAVGDLQAVFLNFWNKQTGQNICGAEYYPGYKRAADYFPALAPDTCRTAGDKCVGVVNRDVYQSPRIIHDTFVMAIDQAREQIQIINPYFTLCRHIKRALRRALRRGVDVQIMVSEKSDIPVTPRVVEYNVHRLMRRGAEVYFFQGGFHHSKVMMIDSCMAFVGSANLNSRSLSFDYECNLMLIDRPSTLVLQQIFELDKQQRCHRLTPEYWRSFSRWKRWKGWLFHFLTPVV